MSERSGKHLVRREEPVATPPVAETAFILVAIWAVAGAVLVLLPNSRPIVPVALLASVGVVAAARFPEPTKKLLDTCFAYRWLLALVVFALCVGLRLHGSSIGIYDEVLPTTLSGSDPTIFGMSRWIRSDEFGVATPTFFSQAYNGHSLFSTQMSLSPTNMVLDYFAPVWDVAALGKPLLWGYLLLGNEYGLSWYWCGQLVLLFMTAFETCLILTQGHRLESLLGGLMVALSPAIQWWFLPHMPIVILYAMTLFCLGYAFFTAEGRAWRVCSAVLASMATEGFVLSIFPSFQVPCAYVLVALLVACLVRDRSRVHLSREVCATFGLALLASVAMVGWVLWNARDGLALIAGTVYPGSRFETGGARPVTDLFCGLDSFFLPYQDNTVGGMNSCESASYLHVAPFFVILAPRMFVHLARQKDKNAMVGGALLVLLLLQGLFMVVGIPRWLAQLTLLRYCNRMHEVYGWVAVLYTVWGLSVLASHPSFLSKGERVLYPVAYGALSLYVMPEAVKAYFGQMVVRGHAVGQVAAACALLGIVLALALALFRRRGLMGFVVGLAMFFAGATVNPVEQGIGALIDRPLAACINEVCAAEPESRWLCVDTPFYFSTFALANGAHVLDTVNFYPDVQKWELLDPSGAFEETTNRYANECATLVDEPTSMEITTPDCLYLRLNPQDLKTLQIRYLVSQKDHADLLLRYGIACEPVGGQDGFTVYRLTYDGLADEQG